MTNQLHSVSDAADHVASAPPGVVYVVGARPNFVKMAPVVREMRTRAPRARHIIVHTGQHYDKEMSDIFFAELGLSEPDHYLGVGSGSHGRQTASALERLEQVLMNVRPSFVVVPGDVNSSLAAALAAAKLGIPIAHLEAGLRSFDRTMPEEINRVLIDQVSRWCFIHSPEAETNLSSEGISSSRQVFAGNTMIDTLVRLRARISASMIHTELGLESRNYLLVTLHRPALVDGPIFLRVMAALVDLARDLPVVFPVHPRTRARMSEELARTPGLHLVNPIGYVDFLALQTCASGVLTDSGGVQEETTFLRVPCFTLRANTERPVTLTHGTNHLLGLRPEAIRGIPASLARRTLALRAPSGWDGHAARRVADALLPWLGSEVGSDSQEDVRSLAGGGRNVHAEPAWSRRA